MAAKAKAKRPPVKKATKAEEKKFNEYKSLMELHGIEPWKIGPWIRRYRQRQAELEERKTYATKPPPISKGG